MESAVLSQTGWQPLKEYVAVSEILDAVGGSPKDISLAVDAIRKQFDLVGLEYIDQETDLLIPVEVKGYAKETLRVALLRAKLNEAKAIVQNSNEDKILKMINEGRLTTVRQIALKFQLKSINKKRWFYKETKSLFSFAGVKSSELIPSKKMRQEVAVITKDLERLIIAYFTEDATFRRLGFTKEFAEQLREKYL